MLKRQLNDLDQYEADSADWSTFYMLSSNRDNTDDWYVYINWEFEMLTNHLWEAKAYCDGYECHIQADLQN